MLTDRRLHQWLSKIFPTLGIPNGYHFEMRKHVPATPTSKQDTVIGYASLEQLVETISEVLGSNFVDHWKGKYISEAALNAVHAESIDGDYAIVDLGDGSTARLYIWDAEEGWVDSGEVKVGTTSDQLTEGSTNLFFTTVRVLSTVLTGLSVLTATPVLATDTILVAIGKLQAQITSIGTSLTTHLANTSNPHSTTAAQVGADPTGTAATAVGTHVSATDPHGDRAFTTAAINTHAADTDPHGDRAYAAGLVTTEASTRAAADTALSAAVALKLDASAYNEHYRGKYATLAALQAAIPTGNQGDNAIVDAGAGATAHEYVWDNEAGWVATGNVDLSTTDALVEGSTNLYFTPGRVLSSILTGLSLASTAVITAADSVLSALGKLQAQIELRMLTSVYDTDADGVVDAAETIRFTARNVTGSTITKGSVVYINGAAGSRPTIALANASVREVAAGGVGVAVADIPNNTDGIVVTNGTLHNLNTSAYAEGDKLWLSTTVPGGMMTTRPPAPDHSVFIGYVARSHATQGRIIYRIVAGAHLEELHDVLIPTPVTNDFLMYDAAGLWKNKNPTDARTALGLGFSVRTITANDSVVSNDSHLVVTGNNVILTLPDAAVVSGKSYHFKCSTDTGFTILPFGASLIDGETSLTILYRNTSLSLTSDGINWIIW